MRMTCLITAIAFGAAAPACVRAQGDGSGPVEPASQDIKLKHVAAADAVADYYRRVGGHKSWHPSLAAEPVTNTVLVSGELNDVQWVLRMLASIDEANK